MTEKKRPSLSVVIPVYRSAGTLETLVVRLVGVLDETALAYEIVLVDDGSPDESWSVLRGLQARYPDHVSAIQLMRNFGQHNALMCGFRLARGDLILTMDDDLQNPPEEVPKLLGAIREGDWDLVYGHYAVKCHRRWQNMGSAVVRAFHQWVFKTRSFKLALHRFLIVGVEREYER